MTSDIPASANSISLRAGTGAAGELVLEIVATDVVNVYAVSFELSYPDTLLQFVEGGEGTFLSGGGSVDTSLQVFQEPGNLTVGMSRVGQVGGTSGTGLIMQLTFTTSGSGTGRLEFGNQDGVDGSGQLLDFLAWIDAQVQVN